MKKVLYSTTALAAAGMFAFSPVDAQAAEKLKLGLGGYFIWSAGVSDTDAASQKNQGAMNMYTDSEIYFRGNTTLDNGIRFDVIVQLETDHPQSAAGGNGNVIDESYIKVGNMKQWGELRLGTTKQAHFIFKVNAPAVNTITNALNSDQSNLYVPSTTPLKGAGTFFNHEGGADRMLAMYVTPNINGFQGGISYTPSQDNTVAPPKTKGMMATEANNISIGANFKHKLGDAGIALSGGWTKVGGKKGDAAEYTTTQFGGSVSMAGFTVGGGWAQRSDDTDMSKVDDIEGFMAGVGYKTGPWQVALTWINTTDDVSMNPGKVEHNQYTLGVAYSLGAGVSVGASVFTIDLQDEDKVVDDMGTPDDATDDTMSGGMDNEGWGMLAGIRVNF